MNEVSDQEKRSALVFVLQKLRNMTLEDHKFKRLQYWFEYYDTPDNGLKSDSYLAQNEPAILNYLEQAGVITQTVIDDDSEFTVYLTSINSRAEKEMLQKLGLEDLGYKIVDNSTPKQSSNLPLFDKSSGVFSIGNHAMTLKPNTYQYLICKHCMDNFGNYVAELEILDDYSHDASMQERTIRDATKALNDKAQKTFNLSNLFVYSSGSVRINIDLFTNNK